MILLESVVVSLLHGHETHYVLEIAHYHSRLNLRICEQFCHRLNLLLSQVSSLGTKISTKALI